MKSPSVIKIILLCVICVTTFKIFSLTVVLRSLTLKYGLLYSAWVWLSFLKLSRLGVVERLLPRWNHNDYSFFVWGVGDVSCFELVGMQHVEGNLF